MQPAGSEQDVTVASYEAASDRYLNASAPPTGPVLAFLDAFAELVGTGVVLELGSGPGWDAARLEARGLRVERTDAATSFVERLRALGHQARVLDVRSEDYGGPYDAVLADAVLLHLSREQFVAALRSARSAVHGEGLLGLTLKEGDGNGWSHAKVDLPRYFTYWREPVVREALVSSGWRVVSIKHVPGRSEPWLFVTAESGRPRQRPSSTSAE